MRYNRFEPFRSIGLGDCLLFGAGCVLFLGACTPAASGPALVPVEGVVTLDDKPLVNANVMLMPRGETRGQAVFAKTDANGKFAASSPDGKLKGATVGSYQVVINKLVKPDGSDFVPDPNAGPEDTGGFRELLPAGYSDQAQSTLAAEVPEAGAKSLEFKLKSKRR